MKVFNQKGLSLIEVMVVIFILGIVTVGIMKQMDFQMKTQSHMNQKMTTDLFTQGLKELLSSEDACSNSMGGIKISSDEDMSFKELKDHRGNVLYKTADSEETSGKNKIDDSVKIKSMKVLSFTKDEDENSDEGFLTLEIELEKLNKSMANQVFKRKIDAIRGSVGPNRFSFKAAMTTESGYNQASTLIGFSSKEMGNKYIKAEQITSGTRLSDLFLIRSGHENKIYFIASESLTDSIKEIKVKRKDNEKSWSFDFELAQKHGPWPNGGTNYYKGVDSKGLNDERLNFITDEEYEVEIITGNSYLSSCRYVGMRKTASLGGGLANSGSAIPGCEATNSPEVKCGGNKAITENVPALDHQDTHKLNARKVTNGNAECVCAGNFICDGLTLNSNNKGTISDKGVICIPKTILADLTGTGRDGRDGAIAGVCGVQDLTHTNGCLYKLKTTLVHDTGSKVIFTTEADAKRGAATVKCNAEGRVEFESATCDTYTCQICEPNASCPSNALPIVNWSDAGVNKNLSTLLKQARSVATVTFGLPGENVSVARSYPPPPNCGAYGGSCTSRGSSFRYNLTCTATGWIGTKQATSAGCWCSGDR